MWYATSLNGKRPNANLPPGVTQQCADPSIGIAAIAQSARERPSPVAITILSGLGMRTTMSWTALFATLVLLAPDRVLAAAVEVDARTAHRAVWKVYGGGKTGTAFAIGDRHFLTCAHVIKGFADQGATEVFIDRYGSPDSRTLEVNYGHVALTLVQDIALFSNRETVDHYFVLSAIPAREGESGLRVMGHPGGERMQTLRQTDPVAYQNAFHLEVATDTTTRGGTSGSPVFRDDGKVVGMHCQGSDNVSASVKVGLLRKFLDGDLPWTACSDHPSVRACIDHATRQTRELAEAGDLVAQYQLGRDDGHLDKDPAMLRRAADGGFAPAQTSLGQWSRERKQWAEAARWYKRSAEQGDPSAKVGLALAYYRGQGVPRNRVRAFRLMLAAARTGDAVAHHNVGVMYQRGNGTAKDLAKARLWLQRAADRGNEEARERLESLPVGSTDRTSTTGRLMRALKRSNVRAGPGTSHTIVQVLAVGERARVIERRGNWFRLQPRPGKPDRFVYAPLLAEAARSKVTQ